MIDFVTITSTIGIMTLGWIIGRVAEHFLIGKKKESAK
jgi:hypothetical protein